MKRNELHKKKIETPGPTCLEAKPKIVLKYPYNTCNLRCLIRLHRQFKFSPISENANGFRHTLAGAILFSAEFETVLISLVYHS